MEGHLRKRNGSWYYSFETAKINGRRHRVERFGGKTRSEASNALREALNRYYNGESTAINSNMSLKDYLDFWFTNYVKAKLKYNTQENYRNVINKYINPKLGYYPLKGLTTRILEDFSQSLLKEYDLANHSMEIIVAVLKKAIRMAVFPYELINNNPAEYISYPKRQYTIDDLAKDNHDDLKLISFEDYQKLLNIIPDDNGFKLAMQISFWTGLRRGEVCGLEWSNIDLNNAELKVTQQMISLSHHRVQLTTPKTKNSYRTVPISSTLIEILRKQKLFQKENKLRYGNKYYDSEFVCTKKDGKPVTPNVIKYSVTHYRKDVDFDFNFHSFRHTHATMLVAAGANWKDIQKRMGHSRLSTTMDTYAHVSIKRQKEVAEQFEEYINQINM